MKTISRIVAATLAFSIAAIPMAQAGPHDGRGNYRGEYYGGQYQPHRGGYPAPGDYREYRPLPPRGQVHRAPDYRRHWKQGQRFHDWRRYGEVRDYQRHGLRRPAHGQQWVRVDNDFLLMSLATGLIVGVIAATR